jgi:hypothetical protein
VGARATDDGVKGAATDITAVLTDISGSYNPEIFQYQPPPGYQNWQQVIAQNNIDLEIANTVKILPPK